MKIIQGQRLRWQEFRRLVRNGHSVTKCIVTLCPNPKPAIDKIEGQLIIANVFKDGLDTLEIMEDSLDHWSNMRAHVLG